MKFELNYHIKREAKNDIHFNLDTSYPIDAGILGVFGQSGTGKSSFLKALAGLAPRASYSIELDNTTYSNAVAADNPCVYVGADSVLFDHLDVLGNLKLVENHGKAAKERCLDIKELISLCAIEHLLSQPTAALSSGEKQRVIFARALLSGKKLMLLDEAFSALDWPARRYFIELLKTLKRQHKLRFILVSHSMRVLALVCQHIWVLQEGKFVWQADLNAALDKMMLCNNAVENTSAQTDSTVHTNRYGQFPNELLYARTNDTSVSVFSETLFSVIELSYLEDDSVDKQLQVWELPAHKNTPAQTILIRHNAEHASVKHSNVHNNVRASFLLDADRISLTFEKHTQTSMLNCIQGIVVGIDEANEHSAISSGVMIRLNANGQILRALISKRSLIDMQIRTGDTIFALFKAL